MRRLLPQGSAEGVVLKKCSMFCQWWDEISELVCVLFVVRVHQDAFVFDEFGV
jgi:hypothetical protein